MNLFDWLKQNPEFELEITMAGDLDPEWHASITIHTPSDSKLLAFMGRDLFGVLTGLCDHISNTIHAIQDGPNLKAIHIPHLEIGLGDVISNQNFWVVELTNDKLKVSKK